MQNSNQMIAAVYEGDGVLAVKKIAVPEVVRADDVKIRVHAVSICGTDVRALTKPQAYAFHDNIVVGHECTGEVVEIGAAVTNVAVGDQVVVHPNNGCGKCVYCRTGKINLCERFAHIGDTVDGVLAEYAVVPEKLVYPIDSRIPAHLACLAEPLACVLNGTETVRAHPGETVVVQGAGPIGLLFVMLYKAAGATVIVSDLSESRGALARSVGADAYVNPAKDDLRACVLAETGVGADIVVDAVGVLLGESIPLVKKGGHVLVFGLNTAAEIKLRPAEIVMNEIQIHGTYIAKGTFPMAVRILEKGLLPLERIVPHRLPIEQIEQGLELMKSGEGSKVVIEIATRNSGEDKTHAEK